MCPEQIDSEGLIMKKKEKKIYGLGAIAFGTMLGGLPVTGYMLANNFSAFGEGLKAAGAWFCCITGTLLLFGLGYNLPEGRYLSGIPFLIAGLVYYIVRSIQGVSIESFVRAGGKEHGKWNGFLVSVAGLAILVLTVLAWVHWGEKAEYTSKTYGPLQHEIVFYKENLPLAEADKLAGYFTRVGFFDDELQKSVFVEKTGTNYEIYISINEQARGDNEAYAFFRSVRDDLQSLCPDHKIVLNLMVDTDVSNVVQRID